MSKLSGGPIEVALSALWTTLGDFKREANNQAVFAHEALSGIRFEGRLFKHDNEGESAEERAQRAIAYLAKLIAGSTVTWRNGLIHRACVRTGEPSR